jgi:membrane dipeptidase
MWKEVGEWVREHHVDWNAPEAEAYRNEYLAAHPPSPTSVRDVADHIDHVVRLVGVDHVGIGSDFDGVSEVPVGLSDVSQYPNLVAELLRRGYADDDVRKILGENILRVWGEVERIGSSS